MKKIRGLNSKEFQFFKKTLHDTTGINIADKRELFFENRLFRYMRKYNIDSWEELIARIKVDNNNEIVNELIPYLTTNKTEFNRENEHFKYLQENYLKEFNNKKQIYAWCAASSTGEEIYSLAVVLKNHFSSNKENVNIRILGSDIDRDVLEVAKKGVYSQKKIQGQIEQLKMKEHLLQGTASQEGKYRFSDEIMQSIKFIQLNLIETAKYPKMKFDIIMLRNVLIYFDIQTIKSIIEAMISRLADGGVLILGLSENLKESFPELEYLGKSMYRKISQVKSNIKYEQKMKVERKINRTVVIVDDSLPMQKILMKIIESTSELKVIGVAYSAEEAKGLIEKLKPDVITLDIQMPQMNGIDFLKKVVPTLQHDVGVVIVSSYNRDDFNYCIQGLEAGAFEYIEKPCMNNMELVSHDLVNLLKRAITSKKLRNFRNSSQNKVMAKKRTRLHEDLIMIGASTGGVVALKTLFTLFPENIPPVVVVQHIPAQFSRKFADSLNSILPFHVKEVEDSEELRENTVYISPGGKQVKINFVNGHYKLFVTNDPPVNRHAPSVDYLFNSLAATAQSTTNIYAIILTGMGKDGALGLKALRHIGAVTVAQDEESSVVFGMPREAIEIGAAQYVEDLESIPHLLFKLINDKEKKCA